MDFLFKPTGAAYDATQQMTLDQLGNRHKDLANQTMEAQLPGVRGVSQSQVAKGMFDTQTLDTSVAATNAGNTTKVDDAKMASMAGMAEKVTQMGALLEGVPEIQRPAAFKQIASSFGLAEGHPAYSLFASKTPQELTAVGQRMAQASAKHQQNMALQGAKSQSAEEMLAARLAAQERIAAANNAARTEAARLAAEAKAAGKGATNPKKLEERLVALLAVPLEQRDEEWYAAAKETSQMLLASKQAGVNPMSQELVSGKQVTTPAQRTQEATESILRKPQAPTAPTELPNNFAAYRKLYPSTVTDAQIRAAYKAKTGKELN